jgi:hypothetical protein
MQMDDYNGWGEQEEEETKETVVVESLGYECLTGEQIANF